MESRDQSGADIDQMESIESSIRRLHENNFFPDVEFHVTTGESSCIIRAHKLLLACRSPILADVFYKNKHSTVTVADIGLLGIQQMIRYIYFGDLVSYTVASLQQAWKASVKFGVKPLEDLCFSILAQVDINTENVCEVLQSALIMGQKEVFQKCLSIAANETEAVLNSSSFMHASLETLLCIYQLPEMNVSSEARLLHAAIEWLQKHRSSIEREKLLSSVEIMCLNRDEFLEVVKTFPSFFSDWEILSILLNILNCNSRELPSFCKIKDTKRKIADSKCEPCLPEVSESATQTSVLVNESATQTSILVMSHQSTHISDTDDYFLRLKKTQYACVQTSLTLMSEQVCYHQDKLINSQNMADTSVQTSEEKSVVDPEIVVKILCAGNEVIVNCTKEKFRFKFGLSKIINETECVTHFCLQQGYPFHDIKDNEQLISFKGSVVKKERMSHLIGYLRQGLKPISNTYDSTVVGKLMCDTSAMEFHEYSTNWLGKEFSSSDDMFKRSFPTLSISMLAIDKKWEFLVFYHLREFLKSQFFKTTPPEFVFHVLKQEILPLHTEVELLEGIIIWLQQPGNMSFHDAMLNKVAVLSLTSKELDYICETFPHFFSPLERSSLKKYMKYGNGDLPCWCEASHIATAVICNISEWITFSADEHYLGVIKVSDKINLEKCYQIPQAENCLRYEPFLVNTCLKFHYSNNLVMLQLGFGTEYSEDFRIDLFFKVKDLPKKVLEFRLFPTPTNFYLLLFNPIEASSSENVTLDIQFKTVSGGKLFAITDKNGCHPYITIEEGKIPCFQKDGEWTFIISKLYFFPKYYLKRDVNDI